MRQYELIIIISSQVTEEEVPDAIDRLIRQPIEGQGGEIQEVNQWGRRKLAYPIQKQLEGNYVLTQLRLDPQRTKELEQKLTISEEVIRHLLIRLDDKEE
ncbi:MAG: 30S ribosomal protein S6 [Chloroflexi bacterium]|nr:30S ribosomal protein S6 [Chloroflexota bacterium]